MPFKQCRRTLDFMRRVLPEHRRSSRVHLPVQATVFFQELCTGILVAFLRDLNMLGPFCYCTPSPAVGHHARSILELPNDSEKTKATCEGTDVRVEQSAPGAATGVAIKFTSFGVSRSSKAEKPEGFPAGAPFINWTVEMVELAFAKSRQLSDRTRYASRPHETKTVTSRLACWR